MSNNLNIQKTQEILRNCFLNSKPLIIHSEIYKHNGNDYHIIILEFYNGYDAGIFNNNKWIVYYKTSENDIDDFMHYKLDNDNTFITKMVEKVKNGINKDFK